MKSYSESYKDAGVDITAGYKAVEESVKKPLEYYENNLCTTFNLIKKMKKYNVKKL